MESTRARQASSSGSAADTLATRLNIVQMNNIIAQLLQQNRIVQQNSEGAKLLENLWVEQRRQISDITDDHWKSPEMPLARIKKIMKMDEEVKLLVVTILIPDTFLGVYKQWTGLLEWWNTGMVDWMISGEVPVLLNRAVIMFISELTIRAWIQTEDAKRRTVQRGDIALAITKCDMFDFLIDIVPREEILFKINRKQGSAGGNNPKQSQMNMFQSLSMEQLQTCLQMAVQQLISNATDASDTTTSSTALQQQQDEQHPQGEQELGDMTQNVSNFSTEQMQQLLQLQQHQSALSMLNHTNESHELQTLDTVNADSLLNQQEVTTIDYGLPANSNQIIPQPSSSSTTQLSHEEGTELMQHLEQLHRQRHHEMPATMTILQSLTNPTSPTHTQ